MKIITKHTLSDFSVHLKTEEKSKNTIEKYLRDVRAFAATLIGEAVTKKAVTVCSKVPCRICKQGYCDSCMLIRSC